VAANDGRFFPGLRKWREPPRPHPTCRTLRIAAVEATAKAGQREERTGFLPAWFSVTYRPGRAPAPRAIEPCVKWHFRKAHSEDALAAFA
jgi:hypothetical protein